MADSSQAWPTGCQGRRRAGRKQSSSEDRSFYHWIAKQTLRMSRLGRLRRFNKALQFRVEPLDVVATKGAILKISDQSFGNVLGAV